MEITESALTAQYQRASSAWPFIHQAGLARGLPGMLLVAAGSPGSRPGRADNRWAAQTHRCTPPDARETLRQ
jgi:hypothetical protein